MKIKVGLRFKSSEGIAKGKLFTVIYADSRVICYKSKDSGVTYTSDREFFEKFLKRTNQYWSNKNKEYKKKKREMA